MRSSLVTLSMLGLVAGCADATSIMVEVSSDDLVVPADVNGLQFDVRSESGHSVSETFAIATGWPHSLAVLPASSQEGRVTITVTGLDDGVPVVRRIVESAFAPGAQRTVPVRLDRACLGLPCAERVDCIEGLCVGSVTDGGVDAGMDAGPLDAGVRDAGSMDGGSSDAGRDAETPRDAGRDGGPDAGRDGGTDAGRDGGTDAGRTPAMLLFTEYIEGSSLNKALEIHNLASGSFDMSRCELQRFSNGAVAPFPIALTGTVAAGDFFVVCNSSIDITTGCDHLTGALNHNGDDAYALVCDGSATPIDTFGLIGVDPGTAWTGGGISTVEYVLTRRCTVTSGDTNGSDAFDPSTEWQGAAWVDAATSLAGLGARAECP